MGYPKGEKLNQLQRLLPSGLVVTTSWLKAHGYSSALLSKYVNSGWLEQPARGVYRRPAGTLLWQHVVVSLQTLLRTPVFVGGRTALEEEGLAHYVSATGPREIHLYSSHPCPNWIKNLPLEETVFLHKTTRLSKRPVEFSGADWNSDQQAFVDPDTKAPDDLKPRGWGAWQWPIVASTPERAVLELLDEIPRRETFHQADMLVEGLRTLSPRRMQTLLEECRNVKVKRLLLWFAERHQLPWARELNLQHIDLGAGKRSLVPNGKLDSKYLITVPRDMHGKESSFSHVGY